jgi:hypothetical protein
MSNPQQRLLAADITRLKANVAACSMSFMLLCLIILSLR